MRGFLMNRYGGPEVTELRDDISKPTPQAGEVCVSVCAAGLNPVDFKIREGKLKAIYRYQLPVVLGGEIAGFVHSVGQGVTRFSEGDRVFARLSKKGMGGLAEFVVVEERHLAIVPDSLDFETAAAVPLAGLTALQVLRDEIGVREGQRIFITGGAGGVGTFAIQIAKYFGATVITTASPRGEKLVRRLGADEVIDYTSERFDELLSDCDGVFDLIGGMDLERSFSVTRRGGTVVSVAGLPEPQTAFRDLGRGFGMAALFWVISFRLRRIASRYGVRYRFMFMHPSGADLDFLASLIQEKKVEVVVDSVFSFEDTHEAFALLESGRAKGKIVVKIAE